MWRTFVNSKIDGSAIFLSFLLSNKKARRTFVNSKTDGPAVYVFAYIPYIS